MTTVKKAVVPGGPELDHTILAYMKAFVNDQGATEWRIYTSAKAGEDNMWTERALLATSGYFRHIDPVLQSNPFSDGFGPKKVYLASLMDNGLTQPPQVIKVWRSDEGGFSWNTPVDATQPNIDANFYLDKPDMDVSQHAGTRGVVYVSYTKKHQSIEASSEIHVVRSTTEGQNWSMPVTVVTGRVQASQVVVNQYTGRVYCLWTDYTADEIRMSYSDNPTVQGSWSAPETAASGFLKSSLNSGLAWSTPGRTIPQARYDWINDRLVVTWHESEYAFTGGTHTGSNDSATYLVDSSRNFFTLGVKVGDSVINLDKNTAAIVQTIVNATTLEVTEWVGLPVSERHFDFGNRYTIKARDVDIFYTAKPSLGTWLSKVRLNVPLLNDQFQSAIDFNTAGELMIGYYDRSVDIANRLYEVRWVKINTNGGVIASGQLPDPFYSDPYDNIIGVTRGFIGDYTDTWFWTYTDSFGPRFHTVFCGGAGNGDIYLAGLQ